MITLTQLQADVLNSTADDYENLEQIYRSLALEFSATSYETGNGAYYWREKFPPISLMDIADAILLLAQSGLLHTRMENGAFRTELSDPSFVWKDWFRISSDGKDSLACFAE